MSRKFFIYQGDVFNHCFTVTNKTSEEGWVIINFRLPSMYAFCSRVTPMRLSDSPESNVTSLILATTGRKCSYPLFIDRSYCHINVHFSEQTINVLWSEFCIWCRFSQERLGPLFLQNNGQLFPVNQIGHMSTNELLSAENSELLVSVWKTVKKFLKAEKPARVHSSKDTRIWAIFSCSFIILHLLPKATWPLLVKEAPSLLAKTMCFMNMPFLLAGLSWYNKFSFSLAHEDGL